MKTLRVDSYRIHEFVGQNAITCEVKDSEYDFTFVFVTAPNIVKPIIKLNSVSVRVDRRLYALYVRLFRDSPQIYIDIEVDGNNDLTSLNLRSSYMTPGVTRRRLWGVADLHTHPAMHMGLGAVNGDSGLLHGNPGLRHDQPEYQLNLPACGHCHTGYSINIAQQIARGQVIAQLLGPNEPHNPDGWPNYSNWPHAKSPIHQQMHVTWIHRAYLAGLRLMVACVTDSHILTDIWHQHLNQYEGGGGDKGAAINQLTFISSLVACNSSWMSLVKSAAEARQAIEDNKLAIVLGLEMDRLSPGEIVDLAQNFGVSIVTPVHTIDNPYFGGTALYENSNIFNAENYHLNSYLFRVKRDKDISFRLDPNLNLTCDILGLAILTRGHIQNDYADPPNVCSQYGHRNDCGLINEHSLIQLMKAGLIIDIAHMSEECTEETIAVAERYSYPLVDTHTGIRPASGKAESERELRSDHAQRLAALNGLIGVGTGYTGVAKPISTWLTQFRGVMNAVGGKPVALGTDMNGLALQIEKSEVHVPTTFNIPNVRTPFPQLVVGQRAFDFNSDGLAHYGMLPDFLYALGQADQTGECIDSLYSSADAFVRMWERVEEAKRQFP